MTPLIAVCQSSWSFALSWSLLKFMPIELMMLSTTPFSFCLQSFLALGSLPMTLMYQALCISWPKYWRFNFSISPFNEYSGLISFRIDLFDLLAVQGTLKGLHSKAPILQCSVFFMVQLSHPYMTTGKTIALTIWTFVSKVISLLLERGLNKERLCFSMLGRFSLP